MGLQHTRRMTGKRLVSLPLAEDDDGVVVRLAVFANSLTRGISFFQLQTATESTVRTRTVRSGAVTR